MPHCHWLYWSKIVPIIPLILNFIPTSSFKHLDAHKFISLSLFFLRVRLPTNFHVFLILFWCFYFVFESLIFSINFHLEVWLLIDLYSSYFWLLFYLFSLYTSPLFYIICKCMRLSNVSHIECYIIICLGVLSSVVWTMMSLGYYGLGLKPEVETKIQDFGPLAEFPNPWTVN